MSKQRTLSVKDAFNGPVKDYSIYANHRAIPSLMDGFKPSQRKVIFASLQSSIPDTGIKVSQLSAQTSLVSCYHHGEASLDATIVGLAQDFSGANNLNYLSPLGQFGSRMSPANAASRYIFTKLNNSFRKVFKKEDDLILEHLYEDGDKIEPKFYLPILPSVLINGSEGMGTGYACKILQYNPSDLKKYILNILKGKKENIKLTPWFRGFNGSVDKLDNGQIVIKGNIEKVNTSTLAVTELPVGMFQDDFKAVLIKLMDSDVVKDYERDAVDSMTYKINSPRIIVAEEIEQLLNRFKLISRVSENFTVWLPNGKLKCFDSPEALTDTFVEERLKYYEIRRIKTIEALTVDYEYLDEKARFIKYYLDNSKNIATLTKQAFEDLLVGEGFKSISKLIELKIYNLTKDQIEKALNEVIQVKQEIVYYEGMTAVKLYIKDLEELDLKKELSV
jgi:DNA topoisomerase-2